MIFGLINDALAAVDASAAPHPQQGGIMSMLPMFVIFILFAYFMLIRPQTKRAKQQRELMNKLAIGDEVLLSGGIIGKVTKLRDNFVSVLISKETEILVQKVAVVSVLPKGTMESAG